MLSEAKHLYRSSQRLFVAAQSDMTIRFLLLWIFPTAATEFDL